MDKTVFRNSFERKQSLERRLLGVQKKLARGSSYLINFEFKLRKQLDEVHREEELLWFQKSRMEAICDGDRNTRHFHLSTIIRHKHNRIEALKDDLGNWVWNEGDVKRLVMDYFESIFSGPVTNICLDGVVTGSFPELPMAETEKLDMNYTVTEVQFALNQMSP
ncbi:uncharacterized protein LOC141649796 [Silene latifolia]|uniref:uncharacterized protein LOC141649796 n=1 Tax=Silene latifolia TaxID=37657 RepID=UPI003D77ED67